MTPVVIDLMKGLAISWIVRDYLHQRRPKDGLEQLATWYRPKNADELIARYGVTLSKPPSSEGSPSE